MSRNLAYLRPQPGDRELRPDAGDADLESIERANRAMLDLRDAYVSEWAPATQAELESLLAGLEADRPGMADWFERIYRLAHDMKGQGTTFGYGLLTQIGEALCRLTADRDRGSAGEIMLLRAHVDAAGRILNQRLDGSGGEAGERIMADLALLARRTAH